MAEETLKMLSSEITHTGQQMENFSIFIELYTFGPEDQTINQHYYLEGLYQRPCQKCKNKIPELWKKSHECYFRTTFMLNLHCLSRFFSPSIISQCMTSRLIRLTWHHASFICSPRLNLCFKDIDSILLKLWKKRRQALW